MVYSHVDTVLVIIIIIACIYAESFFMKPNVFLKYESVNSECTPVTRKRASLINSVLWMRRFTMSSVNSMLDSIFFSVVS